MFFNLFIIPTKREKVSERVKIHKAPLLVHLNPVEKVRVDYVSVFWIKINILYRKTFDFKMFNIRNDWATSQKEQVHHIQHTIHHIYLCFYTGN